MTSLFFVMLTLFVVVVVVLNKERRDALERTKELQAKIDKANEINKATSDLDSRFFTYSPEYKKHQLAINVNFRLNSANIDDIPHATHVELRKAGHLLQDFVRRTTHENPNIQYLLVIEGQASKDTWDNWRLNYELSYRRALSLKRFWEQQGVTFSDMNCEVLISGSGDGTLSGTDLMRETDEVRNQRFLIHILPKPGIIGN